MGAYLSSPKTDKISSDEMNDKILCGASSMQGWRLTQEDAHNSILEYDPNASLFAVYDGHGGKEVAKYTAQKLPDFIRQTEAYQKGDYAEALKEAFLQFDATLKEPEVVDILKEIAGTKEDESQSETEDENLGNLKEEAQMPIEEVMAKYASGGIINPNLLMIKKDDKKASTPLSPYLRGKSSVCKVTVECSELNSNKSECSSSRSNSYSNEADFEVSSSSSSCVIPRKSLSEKYNNGSDKTILDSTSNGTEDVNNGINECKNKGEGEVEPSETECSHSETVQVEAETNEEVKIEETTSELPDSSGDSNKTEPSGAPLVNGNGTYSSNSQERVDDTISSSVENGEVPTNKDKGKSLVKKQPKTPEKKETESPLQLFKKFVHSDPTEELSDSDSDDVTFHGPDSTSDDEDAPGEQVEDEEEVEEEEDSEEFDEEEEEDDEDDDFTMRMTDRPGSDSGCTAVVALIKDSKVYVANAGDSRCIVCKNGEVVEMSLDHKPEDDLEMARIKKAGGRVTYDGRVNGGLNLSRALGDHVYKQVADLSAEEQMISPLPDVKVLDIEPDVEFMVLACDGIWNFMSSKEVVDFVRPRLRQRSENISKVCEELFDHCLAPNTLGDGTGCDNMTAVIVKFLNSNPTSSEKRRAEDDEEPGETSKRLKTEDVTSTDSVGSSKPDKAFQEKDSTLADTTQ